MCVCSLGATTCKPEVLNNQCFWLGAVHLLPVACALSTLRNAASGISLNSTESSHAKPLKFDLGTAGPERSLTNPHRTEPSKAALTKLCTAGSLTFTRASTPSREELYSASILGNGQGNPRRLVQPSSADGLRGPADDSKGARH